MRIVNDLKKEKYNHRCMWLVNVFISVFTMIGLLFFNISQVSIYTTKTRVSEVFVKFSAARENVMSDYSYLGHWPDAKSLQEGDFGWVSHVGKITFDGNGTIDFSFSDQYPELKGKKLSFVATQSMGRHTNKIIWSCGFAEPLNGFEPIGVNNTTIEAKYLPNTCRASHTTKN